MMDVTNTEMQLMAVEYGIPLIPTSAPICGATAPITLAGGVLLTNIEALEGVILSQLAKAGSPVLYADAVSVADPRYLSTAPGAAEMGLINAAGAQMAQYYKIPIYSTSGMTDSKIPDAQSGYEKALSSLVVALSGANYIHDAVGLLGFGTVVSYEAYVIDDEINGMILRIVKGIEVNDDTLARDLIKSIGPGGIFASQKHTVRHLRKELFFPKVSDRQPSRSEWLAQGGKDTRERARDIAKKILKSHQPRPIAQDVDKQIKESIPGIV
jgi:trimethylamine--corrinoid protein Co-methyltransferase